MNIPIKYIKGKNGNIIYPYTTIDAVLDKDASAGGASIKDNLLNVIKCNDIQDNQIVNKQVFSPYNAPIANFESSSNYSVAPKSSGSNFLISIDQQDNKPYLQTTLTPSNNGWAIAPLYSQQENSIKTIFSVTFKLNTGGPRFRITLGDINRLTAPGRKVGNDFTVTKNDYVSTFFVDGSKKITISSMAGNALLPEDTWITLTYTVNKENNTFTYSLKNENTKEYIIPLSEETPFPVSENPEQSFSLTDDTIWGLLFSSHTTEKVDLKEFSLIEQFVPTDKFTLFLKETIDENNYEPIFYQNGQYYYMTNMTFKEGVSKIGTWIDGHSIYRIVVPRSWLWDMGEADGISSTFKNFIKKQGQGQEDFCFKLGQFLKQYFITDNVDYDFEEQLMILNNNIVIASEYPPIKQNSTILEYPGDIVVKQGWEDLIENANGMIYGYVDITFNHGDFKPQEGNE